MTTTVTSPRMSNRLAGQAVIEELLSDRAHVVARSRLARVLGRSPLSDSGTAWYLGAQGELAVGRMLNELPAEWTVFHALPVGTKEADIDHIAVGPGGVFAVNTKHHRGKPIWVANRTLMVSGQEQQHIRNAEHEASRVTKLVHQKLGLPGRVRPVVAIHGAASIVVKEKPDLVEVLDARRLRRWLLKRPVVLSPEDQTRIVSLIDDPGTWRVTASFPDTDVLARFAAIDREVRKAAARRSSWALGGIGAVGAAAILAAPPVMTAVFSSVAGILVP